MKSITQIEMEENLSVKVLKELESINCSVEGERPSSNYLDLMNWTCKNFTGHLNDQKNLNKFVHNRIIIDGQFIKFAEENGIKITCLMKDSFISWRTPNDYEKYFTQGVFLIKSKNLEFIHAALFHKGNQNEDEVSFFIIVSENNYKNYISMRNKFDDWVSERDRSNNFVRVIGAAEDIAYDNDSSWDDLILNEEIKNSLKSNVETFLKSKSFYEQNKIPWKTGILLYGPPGCGKTSIIRTIMSNYGFKPVTITPVADDNAIREAFAYAEYQSPSLLYFEDLDSLLERNIDLSSFLNLMDGVSSKNGLMVIATANEIHKLKASVIDRPSRFDKKIEIPLPDHKMAYIYLSKWFGKTLPTTKLKSLAKLSEKNEFSYAYLKELYISSMFEAISKNRKTPTLKDVDIAVNRLMKEKNISKPKIFDSEKYFK